MINQTELKERFSSKSSLLKNRETDSHLLCQLISTTKEKDIEKALEKVILKIRGAFCLVILTENKLIGLRDGYGFHPLV